MDKFKNRIFNFDSFSNKEYAELLKMKVEKEKDTHTSINTLVWVLYIATLVVLFIPFFLNIPDWIDEIISFITPIIYIAAFALQVFAAHKMIISVLGSAFAAGLDLDKPIFDMVVGGLYTALAIAVCIFCPPIMIGLQIKKDNLIIDAADEVISKE